MKKKRKQKILVLVDGSDRALNTVRYFTKVEPFRSMDIVLSGGPSAGELINMIALAIQKKSNG